MNTVLEAVLLTLICISAYKIGALTAYHKGYQQGLDDMDMLRRWRSKYEEEEP